MAVSNQVAFANPNAPVYPRLAQGKQWNEVSSFFFLSLILESHSLGHNKCKKSSHCEH